jgi:hypothetical protein
MGRARPRPVWHLTRGDERPCVLSDQELLLLAELGHLRADDLLWRPGFDGRRTVRSLLGHTTAPPSPISILLSERPNQTGVANAVNPLSSGHQKKPGSPDLIESTDASSRLYATGRNLAGLLVAVLVVGVLGIAMHKSFATSAQPPVQCTAPTESHSAATDNYPASTEPDFAFIEPQQPNPEAPGANPAKPSESTGRAEGDIIVRTVKVLSVAMPQPSDVSALVPNTVSEEPSGTIPPPTKKPVRPIRSPSTTEAEPARTATPAPVFQAPTGFASFGSSNSPN